jgi:hypothetical protein
LELAKTDLIGILRHRFVNRATPVCLSAVCLGEINERQTS